MLKHKWDDEAILYKMFNGASYMMAVTKHSIEVTKNGLKEVLNFEVNEIIYTM